MPATDRARRLAETAALAAADKLAHDVVAIDVSERLPLTDCFVIASAPNERQVQAVVDNVEEKLRALDAKPVRREGTQEARWVLLDFGDVVVHVFHGDEREFYGLERLWKDCPIADVAGRGVRPAPRPDRRRRVSLHRLVLVRHGRTTWNAESRMQGRLDPDLDDTGRAQALAAAPVLATYEPVLLVASDQVRAWRTADAIAKEAGLVPRPDARLRETALGDWEGLTGGEVEAGWPGGLASWGSDPEWAPPGGESRVEVAERAAPGAGRAGRRAGATPTSGRPRWSSRTAARSAR